MEVKGWWWKFSGLFIFLYVIIGGLTIPTRSGITKSQPGSVQSGESVTMTVEGYNTHFLSASLNRAWLKLDSSHAIKSKKVTRTSEIDISITFCFPKKCSSYRKGTISYTDYR